MLLQRLATGATGVKQARRGAASHSYAHAQYIHSVCVGPWHLLFTMHGVI